MSGNPGAGLSGQHWGPGPVPASRAPDVPLAHPAVLYRPSEACGQSHTRESAQTQTERDTGWGGGRALTSPELSQPTGLKGFSVRGSWSSGLTKEAFGVLPASSLQLRPPLAAPDPEREGVHRLYSLTPSTSTPEGQRDSLALGDTCDEGYTSPPLCPSQPLLDLPALPQPLSAPPQSSRLAGRGPALMPRIRTLPTAVGGSSSH